MNPFTKVKRTVEPEYILFLSLISLFKTFRTLLDFKLITGMLDQVS